MVIKVCLNCEYHSVKWEGEEPTSHCGRENCWSRYSKCVLHQALETYLKENSLYSEQSGAAI